MTYSYTRPAKGNRNLKIAAIGFGILALVVTAMAITGPKHKATPLATQPMIIDMPIAEPKAGFEIPEALTYRGVDNAIRDFQMDNAKIGHKMKVAMRSDANPVRNFFIAVDRKFSLMAILVGLAFLFTMVHLGFIRTSKDDLSNY
jgi:hypothetical protein